MFLPKPFAQAAIWSAFSKVSRASMRTPSVGPEISVLLDGAQVATSPRADRDRCTAASGRRRRQSKADWCSYLVLLLGGSGLQLGDLGTRGGDEFLVGVGVAPQ